MTLNCYKFKFSRNFALLRIFGRTDVCSELVDGVTVKRLKNASDGRFSELCPTHQGCRALTFALARLLLFNETSADNKFRWWNKEGFVGDKDSLGDEENLATKKDVSVIKKDALSLMTKDDVLWLLPVATQKRFGDRMFSALSTRDSVYWKRFNDNRRAYLLISRLDICAWVAHLSEKLYY